MNDDETVTRENENTIPKAQEVRLQGNNHVLDDRQEEKR